MRKGDEEEVEVEEELELVPKHDEDKSIGIIPKKRRVSSIGKGEKGTEKDHFWFFKTLGESFFSGVVTSRRLPLNSIVLDTNLSKVKRFNRKRRNLAKYFRGGRKQRLM